MYNVNTRFSVAANALIFNEKGEILLCHRRDKDRWNFPGGAVEKNETPVEAVIRETKEETGLDIEIINLLGVYTKPDEDDMVFAFIAKANGVPTVTNESDQIAYFDPKNIPTNISPFQIERIHDALTTTGAPIFKKQRRLKV